ncbi:MAG: hypothetical protein Q8L30_01465 [bacterium]|nr:hypothetical protein [bacterium]
MSKIDEFLRNVVTEIVNPIILLLSAASFVLFVWGVFVFITHAGDETKRTDGKRAIMWGLVGLVIIFGVYGIINIALGTFSLGRVQDYLPR